MTPDFNGVTVFGADWSVTIWEHPGMGREERAVYAVGFDGTLEEGVAEAKRLILEFRST